jgi:hypothetical protein
MEADIGQWFVTHYRSLLLDLQSSTPCWAIFSLPTPGDKDNVAFKRSYAR